MRVESGVLIPTPLRNTQMRNLDGSKEEIEPSVSSAKLLLIEPFYLCLIKLIVMCLNICNKSG